MEGESSLLPPPPSPLPPVHLSPDVSTHSLLEKSSQGSQDAQRNLIEFVSVLIDACLDNVKERLRRESIHLESIQLVRALDRISGKLQAMDQLLPSAQLSK